MENRYNNNNDFERFVKQNADQYRMFPSEKVWNGIHNRLHTRRRWYGLGLAFLLLSTGVVTWVMLVTPSRKQQFASSVSAPSSKQELSQIKGKEEVTPLVATNRKVNKPTTFSHTPFPVAAYTGQDAQPVETSSAQKDSKEVNPDDLNVTASVQPDASQSVSLRIQKPVEGFNKTTQTAKNTAKPAALPENTVASIEKSMATIAVTPSLAENKEELKISEKPDEKEAPINPLTIESVVNSYKKPVVRKRLTWQAYLTPTVSYRALNENKAFINAARAVTNSATPVLTYLPSDLESVVNHKPDIGFQIGFSAGYPLTKKIKLLSGLQFNINKYDIQAYNYSNEVATVALSTAAGRTNTVSTMTNYRIEGGYNRAKWLRNFYFTASVPVGFEVKIAENKRSYVGFTATAQPTYILDNRSYLVSTDYKNYVEIPSLTRKWNLNTGFEVFAGIKAAGTEWRIGPQVRYQTLSSYKNKYPIEERLFDFGLKLGVVLK